MNVAGKAPIGPDVLSDPAEVAAAYRRWIERTGLADATKRTYAGEVRAFTTWLADQDKHAVLETFTDTHARDYAVRDYRRWMLGTKKRAAKGAELALTAVGGLFIWLELGPPDVPRTNTNVRREPQAMDEDATRAALRAAERRGLRDLALVALALGTGLRPAENAALDLDDVWITERKGMVQVRLGKGDQPRDVPLNGQTREVLRRWLAERRTWPGADGSALWLSRGGDRLAGRTIRYIINEVGKAAGVDLHPHMLRHTFATSLARSGEVDVITLQTLLGHRSPDTTAIYTRPSAQTVDEAVEHASFDY